MKWIKDISSLDVSTAVVIGISIVWLSAGFISDLETDRAAQLRRARDGLMALESAISGYVFDLGKGAPTTKEGGLKKLVEAGYLDYLLSDPWGNEFQYANPGRYTFVDIWSTGPDGVESDDDIVSWDRYGSYVR